MMSQRQDREPLPASVPCEDVIALLQKCLDGDLPWERAETLSLPHRQCCPRCRERWMAGRLLRTVLRHPLMHSARQTETSSVAQFVCESRVDQHHRRRFRRWLAATAAGLAAAVLLGIGMKIGFDKSAHSPSSPSAGTSVPIRDGNIQERHVRPPLRLNETLSHAAGTVLERINDWAEPTWLQWPDPVLTTAPSEPPPWGGSLLTSVRTGLEPVKDTTQKAIDCFLRDLATWQPPSPKS